ncbi:MAG TPA: ABC transporter permease [Ktedonobacterales bacterium]|nr:ABC transporter permease [Ktedonobacterales bacterium]
MRHLIRRILFYLVALWVSITLNFLLPRLSPGNPVQALIGRLHRRVPPQTIHSLEILLGVNNHDSLWTQYIQYLSSLAHGDLGVSITYLPTPVSTIIAQDLPWTLMLVGVTLVISFVVGTLLGVVVAWYRGSGMDTVLPPVFTFLSAIPYFWLALIVLYVFGFVLGWFPTLGGYDLNTTVPGWNMDFITSAISHGILPAFTIIVGSIAGWLLGMRNMMITTLSEDYVLMAEAKGLSTGRIMFIYAARNAILPSITSFALSLGFVVSGALLTEIVFNYPGIGYAFLQAVDNKDYALIQGLFLIIAIAVLAANFLSDLLYVVLDPRVRQ